MSEDHNKYFFGVEYKLFVSTRRGMYHHLQRHRKHYKSNNVSTTDMSFILCYNYNNFDKQDGNSKKYAYNQYFIEDDIYSEYDDDDDIESDIDSNSKVYYSSHSEKEKEFESQGGMNNDRKNLMLKNVNHKNNIVDVNAQDYAIHYRYVVINTNQ